VSTTTPATRGPIAWPTVGRTMPSNPFTAIPDSSTPATQSRIDFCGIRSATSHTPPAKVLSTSATARAGRRQVCRTG